MFAQAPVHSCKMTVFTCQMVKQLGRTQRSQTSLKLEEWGCQVEQGIGEWVAMNSFLKHSFENERKDMGQ